MYSYILIVGYGSLFCLRSFAVGGSEMYLQAKCTCKRILVCFAPKIDLARNIEPLKILVEIKQTSRIIL